MNQSNTLIASRLSGFSLGVFFALSLALASVSQAKERAVGSVPSMKTQMGFDKHASSKKHSTRIEGTLECMTSGAEAKACDMKLTDAKTGKVYHVVGGVDSVKDAINSGKKVAIEGKVKGDSITVKTATAL